MRRALVMALWFAVSTLGAMEPKDLTYITEDYPPENFVRDGVVQGPSVDLLRAVWRKMGVKEQPIRVLPWARGYAMATTKPRIMLFAMARTPEREQSFQWVGPFYRSDIALLAPAKRAVKAKSLSEARRLRVAVIRDDIGVEFLKSKGFHDSSMVLVNSLEQGLDMLNAGRVALLCSNPESVPLGYRKLWSVGEVSSYYALSLDVEPALVARMQKALEALGDERQRILRKYHLAR